MRAQSRVCISYPCQSKGRKRHVTVQTNMVYWILYLAHMHSHCKPKAEQSPVIAFQCGSLSVYVFLYMITGFQHSFERKTCQFQYDSNYFLFLIRGEVFIVFMNFVRFWETQTCLRDQQVLGKIRTCFPEGFDLSSISSYLPFQSSQ